MEYIETHEVLPIVGVTKGTLLKMKVNNEFIYDKKVRKVRADLFQEILERKKIKPVNWIKNVYED